MSVAEPAGSEPPSGTARTLRAPVPVDLATTLWPLQRGTGDPCHIGTPDGAIWRASRVRTGPVSYRLTQRARDEIGCRAWGPGAEEFVETLPELFCLDEDLSGFAPTEPKVADAHRRFPGLRMLRTGRVFETLVPTILEQKVHGIAARRSWRLLVRRYGEPAPGPVPPGLTVPPAAAAWRMVPSWVFHQAGVGPERSRAIVAAARVADRFDQPGCPPSEIQRRLSAVPGIGPWTVAEVSQRALGDADAVSVGDFHLAAMIGWTLAGRPFDDGEMLQHLAPLRPHRYRAIRLLVVGGHAVKPKFGPRTAVTDHSWH
ncbi:DNA-3-methyladenine glycosylase family protein [Skermania piniformis]|uniref:DNA-3-methyladenine glycosylase family protein n=1 Tax=Skermania pinensis TaxID=39122 RepID=UPI00082D3D06|nr:DNA-3-methyladenine glycosylase [Skermania piniformis]